MSHGKERGLLFFKLQHHARDQCDLPEMIGKDVIDASVLNRGDELHPREDDIGKIEQKCAKRHQQGGTRLPGNIGQL